MCGCSDKHNIFLELAFSRHTSSRDPSFAIAGMNDLSEALKPENNEKVLIRRKIMNMSDRQPSLRSITRKSNATKNRDLKKSKSIKIEQKKLSAQILTKR